MRILNQIVDQKQLAHFDYDVINFFEDLLLEAFRCGKFCMEIPLVMRDVTELIEFLDGNEFHVIYRPRIAKIMFSPNVIKCLTELTNEEICV